MAHGRCTLFPEKQQTFFKQLNRWFLSEQGFYVAEAINQELVQGHNSFHGEILLQLGLCGKNAWLDNLSFKHRLILAPWTAHGVSLASSFSQIPLNRNSVDCVLAPFTVDAFWFFEDLLDEIDRILKPLGYAIFIGINPVSLWGCWLRYAHETCFGVDYHRWPRSVLTLKQGMNHRGYMQSHLSSFYYIPPMAQARWIHRLGVLNQIGKMISPLPSAFYCLVVQKYQSNPIKPYKVQDFHFREVYNARV